MKDNFGILLVLGSLEGNSVIFLSLIEAVLEHVLRVDEVSLLLPHLSVGESHLFLVWLCQCLVLGLSLLEVRRLLDLLVIWFVTHYY